MLLQRSVTIILILGTTCAILLKRDIFPFSNYPMYSKPIDLAQSHYRHELRGVTNQGAEVDVNVLRFMPPFWKSSLREALLVDYRKEVVQPKLLAALRYYNSQANVRGREPLKGFRIYRFQLNWPKIVTDIKEDNKFSGDLGPNSELFVEANL